MFRFSRPCQGSAKPRNFTRLSLSFCDSKSRSTELAIVNPHENEHMNGRLSPPSSILATHIAPVNGAALPDVDPKIFAQLIEECLGHDEDAQPRVGTDVAVNHRLICVI